MAAGQAGLTFSLLGDPAISGPRGAIRLESSKALGLLTFLVLQPGPVTRAKLMALLWPSSSEERAAANLRHAAWDLRRKLELPGRSPLLAADRSAVRFVPGPDCFVDVHAFLELCVRLDRADAITATEAGPLTAIAELYRGDLLDGVLVDEAPEFEEWLLAERERLRLRAVPALDRLVELLRPRDLAAALRVAQRLGRLDPWREQTHRTLAELLALNGQPTAALRQLETCRRVLAEELQAVPTAATLELAERIRSGELGPTAGAAPAARSSPSAEPTLPLPPSPLVGRAGELEHLAGLLADPACRLISVLGPGGVGKTRLALEAARRAAAGDRFPDGVVLVPLADLDSPHLVVAAIASELRIPFVDSPDTTTQLVARLGGRRTLLVLDGFEHVLGSADLLAIVLARCAGVKLLVTSRERLCLREEWVLDLGGLEVVAERGGERSGEAGQLFVQTARRVVLGYQPDPAESAGIARVCAAVEGLPLAIELAAGLMRSMRASELAELVERSLDVLTTSLRDVPARQRSLRAVFDHTWRRLGPEEARAFAALAVCAGGFDRAAADTVAGTSAGTIVSLVDSSVLQRAPDGRYRIHEVLRQYALEKLREEVDGERPARERHAHHYLGMVATATPALRGGGQLAAVDLQVEIDNLRLAWRFAVERRLVDLLEPAVEGMALLHETRCCFQDGAALLGDAIAALDSEPEANVAVLCGRLRVLRGGLLVRMGRLDEADDELGHGLRLVGGGAPTAIRALVLLHLGETASLRGRYLEARDLFTQSRELSRSALDSHLAARASSRLGRVAIEQGALAEARRWLEESLEAARACRHEPTVTYALNQLGFVAHFEGRQDDARRLFEQARDRAVAADDASALTLAVSGLGYVAELLGDLSGARAAYRQNLEVGRAIGDRVAVARSLTLLGEVARRWQDWGSARQLYSEALEVSQEVGHQFLVAANVGNLGFVDLATGKLEQARAAFCEQLERGRAVGAEALVPNALVGLAEVAAATGENDEALELVRLARSHPGHRSDAEAEVARVVDALRAVMSLQEVDAALAQPPRRPLDEALEELLARRPG